MAWFHLNDNEAELAIWDRDGPINNATVTVTIKDANENEVSGVTFPLAMDYVAGSDGVYRATVDKALSTTEDAEYTAEITVVASSGRDGFWKVPFTAKRRES